LRIDISAGLWESQKVFSKDFCSKKEDIIFIEFVGTIAVDFGLQCFPWNLEVGQNE
jgi:hypothetical protein